MPPPAAGAAADAGVEKMLPNPVAAGAAADEALAGRLKLKALPELAAALLAAPNRPPVAGAPNAGVLLAPKAGVLDPKVLVPKAGVEAAAPKAGVLLAPNSEGALLAGVPKAGVLAAPKAPVLDAAAPPKLKPVEGAPNGEGACAAVQHKLSVRHKM
jgi:hypothetical protein